MSNRKLTFLQPFLGYSYLWHWQRKTILNACTIGVLCMFTPWPAQMIQCTLLAVLFRANLPLGLAIVWITNPITIPFFLAMTYITGSFIMGSTFTLQQIVWDTDWFYEHHTQILYPLLLGCTIHAIGWSLVIRYVVSYVLRAKIIKLWLQHHNKFPLNRS